MWDDEVVEYDLSGGITGFGMSIRTIFPENVAGQVDGLVSGVTVGADNTLFIGRNGAQEIRRIDKDTGAFISQFAQTVGRAEDLSCDPITYAPLEAIIAKEAFGGFYEAFEVEEGTCPLPGPNGRDVEIDVLPFNPWNKFSTGKYDRIKVAILSSETFDATTEIDQSTIRFGVNGAEAAPLTRCYTAIANNGDNLRDLVCRFRVGDTGLDSDDTEARLTADLIGGGSISGSDMIQPL